MIDELDDVDEVVDDDIEVIKEVNVVNDDVNVNIVSAKVVAITKAKLQAIAKIEKLKPVVVRRTSNRNSKKL